MSSTQSHSLHDHRESGGAESQRVAILNLLSHAGPLGMTRSDIARQLRFRLQSVCGRIGELKESGHAGDATFVIRDIVTGRLVRPVVMLFPGE